MVLIVDLVADLVPPDQTIQEPLLRLVEYRVRKYPWSLVGTDKVLGDWSLELKCPDIGWNVLSLKAS